MTDKEKTFDPYGEEWIKRMMTLEKREIVEFLKNYIVHDNKMKAENEALQVDISMAKEERDFVKSQWRSCFLSCSSPYCAGYFRDVKCEGTLGSMSKSEGEK